MSDPTPSRRRQAAIVVRRRIEWFDTDAAGHWHYMTAFRLFEAAEVSLLHEIGLRDSVKGRLPRVHASADFRATLEFGDDVDVRAQVEEVGTSSVTYRFEIRRGDELCVEGRMVSVLLDETRGVPVQWTEEDRARLLGQR